MAIRIAQKDLQCSIRARFSWREISADVFQMLFPGIEIVHSQSEVVVFVAGEERGAEVAYEMQFLICAESKPSARKRECRARNGFEFQYALEKVAAPLDVGDVDRDVIQFVDSHASLLLNWCCPGARTFLSAASWSAQSASKFRSLPNLWEFAADRNVRAPIRPGSFTRARAIDARHRAECRRVDNSRSRWGYRFGKLREHFRPGHWRG
jgi:hypothetical protein